MMDLSRAKALIAIADKKEPNIKDVKNWIEGMSVATREQKFVTLFTQISRLELFKEKDDIDAEYIKTLFDIMTRASEYTLSDDEKIILSSILEIKTTYYNIRLYKERVDLLESYVPKLSNIKNNGIKYLIAYGLNMLLTYYTADPITNKEKIRNLLEVLEPIESWYDSFFMSNKL